MRHLIVGGLLTLGCGLCLGLQWMPEPANAGETLPAAQSAPVADPAALSEAEAALRRLYEAEFEWRQEQRGQQRDADGDWVPGPHLPAVSAEAQQARLRYWEGVLEQLDALETAGLGAEARINAAVLRQIVETEADRVRFGNYEAPLNSDTLFWTRLHPSGPLADRKAYERYLSRLGEVPRYLAEQTVNLRAGLARGYTPPAVTLQGREQALQPYLEADEANPFLQSFERMPAAIPPAERNALRERAQTLLDQRVVPAFKAFNAFFTGEYLPGARSSLAARDLPDGEAFYRAQIRAHTTLDLSPEVIHEQGLAEVARIRGEMQAILDTLGFAGDLQAFIEFLRTDPQFYAKTPDELLGASAYVAKRVDGELHRVLGFLPRRRFALRPVPEAIAPFYTSGRGGLEACYMNTYALESRPLYNVPALTLHECAPGHSLQAAISREAPGEIPEFRARNYFSGYGEGWGLYTEWLGTQMGIYRTPYEDFGRLSYEMWRAARLVIDTGVHHYGWSRERAIDYLAEHTALSLHEVTTEVDRYISWPGQALAYKLGEMLIRRKRAEAEQALGADFDQRWFHDRILGLRSVPLPVLEEVLDEWIAAGGPDPYADITD